MNLQSIQEARYHGEHPFVVDFFKNLFDPDSLSKTDYPDDIEFDELKREFTNRFGTPEKRSDDMGYLEWITDLPDHLVREYDMDKMYIYLHKRKNMIEIVWE